MPLVLVRIDDRLIHGQVVEGWLRVIQAGRIVVACDQACADPLQIGLMRLAVPEGIPVEVLSVSAAVDAFKQGYWKNERVLLLIPSPSEARRLVEGGVVIPSLNLGGLHDAPGRRMITPHLAMNDEDRRNLRWLADRGVVEVRAVPTDPVRLIQSYLSDEAAS